VKPFIEEYLGNILDENSVKQSFTDTFEVLGLTLYAAQLKTVQQDIDSTFDTRNTIRSNRPRMKTNEVKLALAETLVDLLNDIEITSKKYPALDYMPLINELNEFLTPFLATIKAKSTRNKNAKEAKNATDATTVSTEKVA
jgi:hypothetical protein